MTSTARLSIVLYQLLHKASRRNAFLQSSWPGRGFPAVLRRHLASIEKDELVATSRRIVHNILKGNTRGSGGLSATYPLTFARLQARGKRPESVIEAFLESRHFDSYKELPYCGIGLSIEEAFFKFMDRLLSSRRFMLDRAVLQHEFLMAIMAILAATPHPHFTVRSRHIIRHNGAAYVALRQYDRRTLSALEMTRPPRGHFGRYLYAATTDGRFIHGAIAAQAIAALTGRQRPTTPQATAYLRQFAELGLRATTR